MRKMVAIIISMFTLSVLAVGMMAPRANAWNPFADVCREGQGSSSGVCATDTSKDPISGKEGVLVKATRIVSVVTGVAAIIMIIIGGMLFVLSNGDTNRVATARNTIIYASVGLVIAVLAQLIVTFVVSKL